MNFFLPLILSFLVVNCLGDFCPDHVEPECLGAHNGSYVCPYAAAVVDYSTAYSYSDTAPHFILGATVQPCRYTVGWMPAFENRTGQPEYIEVRLEVPVYLDSLALMIDRDDGSGFEPIHSILVADGQEESEWVQIHPGGVFDTDVLGPCVYVLQRVNGDAMLVSTVRVELDPVRPWWNPVAIYAVRAYGTPVDAAHNGVQDASLGETDADCGSDSTDLCVDLKRCALNSDCESGLCILQAYRDANNNSAVGGCCGSQGCRHSVPLCDHFETTYRASCSPLTPCADFYGCEANHYMESACYFPSCLQSTYEYPDPYFAFIANSDLEECAGSLGDDVQSGDFFSVTKVNSHLVGVARFAHPLLPAGVRLWMDTEAELSSMLVRVFASSGYVQFDLVNVTQVQVADLTIFVGTYTPPPVEVPSLLASTLVALQYAGTSMERHPIRKVVLFGELPTDVDGTPVSLSRLMEPPLLPPRTDLPRERLECVADVARDPRPALVTDTALRPSVRAVHSIERTPESGFPEHVRYAMFRSRQHVPQLAWQNRTVFLPGGRVNETTNDLGTPPGRILGFSKLTLNVDAPYQSTSSFDRVTEAAGRWTLSTGAAGEPGGSFAAFWLGFEQPRETPSLDDRVVVKFRDADGAQKSLTPPPEGDLEFTNDYLGYVEQRCVVKIGTGRFYFSGGRTEVVLMLDLDEEFPNLSSLVRAPFDWRTRKHAGLACTAAGSDGRYIFVAGGEMAGMGEGLWSAFSAIVEVYDTQLEELREPPLYTSGLLGHAHAAAAGDRVVIVSAWNEPYNDPYSMCGAIEIYNVLSHTLSTFSDVLSPSQTMNPAPPALLWRELDYGRRVTTVGANRRYVAIVSRGAHNAPSTLNGTVDIYDGERNLMYRDVLRVVGGDGYAIGAFGNILVLNGGLLRDDVVDTKYWMYDIEFPLDVAVTTGASTTTQTVSSMSESTAELSGTNSISSVPSDVASSTVAPTSGGGGEPVGSTSVESILTELGGDGALSPGAAAVIAILGLLCVIVIIVLVGIVLCRRAHAKDEAARNDIAMVDGAAFDRPLASSEPDADPNAVYAQPGDYGVAPAARGSFSRSENGGESASHAVYAAPTSLGSSVLDLRESSARAKPMSSTAKYLIRPNELTRDKKLGQGAFGVVYRGRWRNTKVAVKVIKESAVTETQLADFKAEAERMMALRPHANVVTFYGLCVEPLMIVTEFCNLGSLDDWRRDGDGHDAPIAVLYSILRDIARGVTHLHYERIIHRDLAARNILLSGASRRQSLAPQSGGGDSSEALIAKVADFGMSRANAEETNETVTRVGPLKWMAPEQLKRQQYSTASDVFAFGVVCFEVISGESPWADCTNADAAWRVQKGERLKMPARSAHRLVKLTERCWLEEAKDRPSMQEVCGILDALVAAPKSSRTSRRIGSRQPSSRALQASLNRDSGRPLPPLRRSGESALRRSGIAGATDTDKANRRQSQSALRGSRRRSADSIHRRGSADSLHRRSRSRLTGSSHSHSSVHREAGMARTFVVDGPLPRTSGNVYEEPM